MRTKRILHILSNRFNPHKIEIIDFTNEHHGHEGQDGSSETHIRLHIGAIEFEDTTLLEAHRRIQDCLKDEFFSGMHALEIHILK
jgi:BolA protein